MNHIIVVNIGQTIKRRTSTKEAMSGAWKARGARQHDLLQSAEVVVGVVSNHIRGVYRVKGAAHLKDDNRYEWDLEDIPACAALVGHRLSPEGTYWKQGDGAGWKPMGTDEFDELLKKSQADRIQFGAHTLLLKPDGNLEIGLAPGYRADIVSTAPLANARERIEAVVVRLGESGAITTYQTIADMLGINATRSVARSITRNSTITAEQAARVIPSSFQTDNQWIAPTNEEGWSAPNGDERSRSTILIEAGLATALNSGDALIDDGAIITDPATLRRYLMV
ncbi:hypothetical protein H8R18_07580 [Nanchangia anserum]|uniref:Uncharacterized protein n=1 Tax=Nanchangia anserum TaxID=2692125 RepID=A0A8I0G916_9ACTO|nr:hypothetical protein [Nanchangia anserum]MBD3689384.1 hypothetical protein [Nanchangia anserum]QOX81591.1 hypothetical protein H8R18_07580 [Nanchangia anserum]